MRLEYHILVAFLLYEAIIQHVWKGGDNLEATQLEGKRLLSLLLLIKFAYTEAIVWGDNLIFVNLPSWDFYGDTLG
ncbi:hypothetical protein NIES3806_18530 [Microcystis aeruginosa NIES-3806]|uniref:Uncharacterized protein n=2 Tax=Microcystis aeruginosa TaxID=1126 RepID=A0A6H9GCC6_MICAE|nr:hypothetical protein NIES3787_32520 [Microcystis aeruginosa NIES-3787]GCL54510.1 hypothetical protein NIES3806_18530 [Microcystis aeruginosa NIES-3806]GCL58138.1 hypothetical protein NIES3807_13020 [Microcystis aeruginosa NIES-3807]